LAQATMLHAASFLSVFFVVTKEMMASMYFSVFNTLVYLHDASQYRLGSASTHLLLALRYISQSFFLHIAAFDNSIASTRVSLSCATT
jgi:hypothetical protein